MALFDNGKMNKFLLLFRNFQITLEDSGTLSDGAKIQYICTLVRGEALSKLDMYPLFGVRYILFPVITPSKEKIAMLRRMRKPRGVKVRRFAYCNIDLNKYLAVLPGAKASDKICETELYKNVLNSIPNSWSKQEYVMGFDCESITFKTAVNMFEYIKIAESIYKVISELSYRKPNRVYDNRAGHMRGEAYL